MYKRYYLVCLSISWEVSVFNFVKLSKTRLYIVKPLSNLQSKNKHNQPCNLPSHDVAQKRWLKGFHNCLHRMVSIVIEMNASFLFAVVVEFLKGASLLATVNSRCWETRARPMFNVDLVLLCCYVKMSIESVCFAPTFAKMLLVRSD